MESIRRADPTALATPGAGAPEVGAPEVGVDAGYTGPGGVTWRIARENVMLLGGGRAVLMQLAHPLVAAGVARHSAFLREPWTRSRRTIAFTQIMAFGASADVRETARAVNRLHRGVVGALGEPVGAFPAGTPYRAQDPDLLLWVFATLVDTGLLLYPLLVGPLSAAERERYYEESRRTSVLLGLPRAAVPPTLADFRSYMDGMLAGPALGVTSEARALARVVLRLPVPAPLRPAILAAEQLTLGLLPPRVRALYEYSWGPRRQAALEASWAITRRLLPLLPPRLRYTARSRAAARRLRAAAP